MQRSNSKYISLTEAEKYCSYSADYLKLRARQGKLKATKIGRMWVTKKEWVEEYVREMQTYKENRVAERKQEVPPPPSSPKRKFKIPISFTRAMSVALLIVLMISGVVFALPNFVKQNLGGFGKPFDFTQTMDSLYPLYKELTMTIYSELVSNIVEGLVEPTKEVSQSLLENTNQVFENISSLPKELEETNQDVSVGFSSLKTDIKNVIDQTSANISNISQDIFLALQNFVKQNLGGLALQNLRNLGGLGFSSFKRGAKNIIGRTSAILIQPFRTLATIGAQFREYIERLSDTAGVTIGKTITGLKNQITRIRGGTQKLGKDIQEFSKDTILGIKSFKNSLVIQIKDYFAGIKEGSKVLATGINKGLTKLASKIKSVQKQALGIPQVLGGQIINISQEIQRLGRAATKGIKHFGNTLEQETKDFVMGIREAGKDLTIVTKIQTKRQAANIREQLVRIKEAGVEFGNSAAKKIIDIKEGIVQGAKSLARAFRLFVQSIFQGTKRLVSNTKNLIVESSIKTKNFFVGVYQFVIRPWGVPPEKVLIEIEEGEIVALKEELQKLKEEGVPAKIITEEIEVSKITKIEPIKEITKEIKTLDDESLKKIQTTLLQQETDVEKLKLAASLGYVDIRLPPIPSLSGGTTITTLGTITAGTWNGDVITTTYGGTGADLSAGAQGGVVYMGASSIMGISAAGTSGYALISGGTEVPTWTNTPSWSTITLAGTILDVDSLDFVGAGDITAATTIKITGADEEIDLSGGNVKVVLGDDLGVNQFQVADSTGAVVAWIDSDGVANFVGGIVPGGNIVMLSGQWIGLGPAAGRIVFTDAAPDDFLTITDSHLLFSADNTYDIGATGATRPRRVYVGTEVVVAGTTTLDTNSLTATGALTLSSGGGAALTLDSDSGTVRVIAGDTLQADTITDGILSINAGAITGATYNGLTITTGVNTFNLTRGTSSFDIATGKTVDIDMDLTVNTANVTLNQSLQTTDTPIFAALKLSDTDASHQLTLVWNENDSAARTLNLLVSGGNRSLTIEADSIINQDLTTDASVSFGSLSLTTDLAVAHGGTGLSTFGGANTILYTTTTDNLSSIATANNGVLVTSGTGVPSIATDIPTAVTIGGAYIYRIGGTDVADADVADDLTISGGTINNTVIGGTTATTATFTNIGLNDATNQIILDADAAVNKGTITMAALSGAQTWTFPDATGTIYTSGNDPLDTIAEWQTLCTNCVDIINDTTGTLSVARGGTGTTTFGGTNTILYTTTTDNLSSITTANNGLLVTSGTGVPSIATDIPTAVTIGGAYIYRIGGTDVADADVADDITASNYLPLVGGTMTGALMIDGSADVVQLTVQGHSTQTSNLVVFEQSGGADVFSIDNSGNLIASGYADFASYVRASELRSEGNIYINYDGADGDSYLYFYEGTSPTGASMKWDDTGSEFDFSHALNIAGGTSKITSNNGDFTIDALSASADTTVTIENSNASFVANLSLEGNLKILEGGASPTLYGIFDVADLSTADKTYTFPNVTGTVVTTGDTGSVTSTMITDATIVGGDLAANISISTTGNIATTTAGTITSAGLLTASNGFTMTTGALSLTATSGSISATGLGASTIGTTNAALTLSTTTSGDILLSPAGNVGIGTIGPDSALHVIGGICVESSDSGCAITSGNLGVNGGTISTSATTANLFNATATTINFAGAATALNLGASGGLTLAPGGDVTLPLLNTKGLTITSDLSGGARSTDVLTISQANNTTYNSTESLLQLTNSDTGTAYPVLVISNAASGASISIEGSGNGRGLQFTSSLTTGTGVYIQSPKLTSGIGIDITAATETTQLTAFTGDYIKVDTNRRVSSGTITDTGSFIDLSRRNVTTSTGNLTISGDLATFSSTCTQTAGTCTDTSNILELNQQYSSATGTVLNVIGAGTGNIADFTGDSITTGTGLSVSVDALSSGSGIAIDSTSTAFAGKLLNITASGAADTTRYGVYSSLTGAGGGSSTNIAGYFSATNATNNYGLIVANGNVGIGTAGPDRILDVLDSGNPQFRITQADGTVYTEFQVAATTGDLTVSLDPGNDIKLVGAGSSTGANLWICKGNACEVDGFSLGDDGSLFVESYAYFGGNTNYIKIATGGVLTPQGTASIAIPSGTGPTVDAAGEIAVDTTSDDYVYYGTAKRVLTYKNTKSVTIESPADADNFLLWRTPFPITITDIECIVDPADSGDSVVIDIQECDSTGDNPATVDAAITCDNDGASDDGSLSNGAIDADDWISIDIGVVTGTVTQVSVTITYTKDAQ